MSNQFKIKLLNSKTIKIPFNKPYLSGKELEYIQEAIRKGKISGNGEFTRKCQEFFEKRYGFNKCLLTNSCTDALEMAALLCGLQPGDEVIVPSFTFVSTANAFALRGAKIVFVDSKPDHPNMDGTLIEELITSRTKAIVAVHYGGVACDMDLILEIADRHQLFVIEDAAQAIDSFYKGKPLGSFGHLGTMSFHETKNIQCGEGGMLMINHPSMIKRAEILWEKGTERVAFSRGEVGKYGWVDLGSSYLPSELNAAYLWAQLENLDRIQERRKAIWNDYYCAFNSNFASPTILSSSYIELIKNLKFKLSNSSNPTSDFQLPTSNLQLPTSNFHLYYLLFPNMESRNNFAAALAERGILAVFHYQSLHRSDFSKRNFPDQYQRTLPNSDRFSDCLLRLPLFFELPEYSHLILDH